MACFLPLRPSFSVGLRVFDLKSPYLQLNESRSPLVYFIATSASWPLYDAVSLLASYVDRKPRSKNTSLKLSDPSAFPEHETLHSSIGPFEPMSGGLCPASPEVPP